MKIQLIAAALLATAPAVAHAQAPSSEGTAATPTCAQALPQIVQLVDQAEAGGLEVSGARDHVGDAEAAQASGDEEGCINALVEAQNIVVAQLPSAEPAPGQAN